MLKTLVAKVALGRNKTIGFSGSQGSGKSTLVRVLKAVLEQTHGLTVASLSLDDFYKTRSARTQMMTEHPMFQVRGVPGTHDIDLMLQAKIALCAGRAAQVPVFDKGLDDRAGTMTIPAGCETVLLEGWCFGARPEPVQGLVTPVNALEAVQDPQGLWRRGVNEYLAGQAYQQLFTVDYWVYFKAPNFDAILDWRAEQEARFNQGPSAMTRSEIEAFIGYYQRITQWMLLDAPGRADLVITLDPDHSIAAVQGDLEFSFSSSPSF
jgi:D-glycerate 3-kinase